MKITIDNFDGQGLTDYSACLSGETPLTIERALNKPSHCVMTLAAGASAWPATGGRVTVAADNGTVLFTGYVDAVPEMTFDGMSSEGPVYSARVFCTSDEALLGAVTGAPAREYVPASIGAFTTLFTELAGGGLAVTGDALIASVGGFAPEAGERWASVMGRLSDAGGASYRAISGAVHVNTLGDVTHTLAESDGSLDQASLRGRRVTTTIDDITVCGAIEPQAYVTEIFQGDGVTAVFELGEAPLMESRPLSADTFSGSEINRQMWSVVDTGGLLSTGANGLLVGGGTGSSGTTTVTGVNAVEVGGVLTLELSGLLIATPGEAYVAALSIGGASPSAILAGFHLRANGASVLAVPVVQGAEVGASFALQTGHTYTLRLRFHSKERQRTLQTYIAHGAGGAIRMGGAAVPADADLVMEVQETTNGALTAVTVLYDGEIANLPAVCKPLVIDSVTLGISVASFEMKRPGDVWVTCAGANTTAATQRLGTEAQSAQAKVTTGGRLSFYPGSVPPAGSTIRVCYRLAGRAVARMSAASAPSAGGPTAGRLIVTAEQPVTRTSLDCENAALALLSVSTWSDGGWKGTYSCWNPQNTADIWPGDALHIDSPSAGIASDMLVRTVLIAASCSAPELLHYTLAYANEWAESIALHVKETSPAGVWLPPVASTSATALASLGDLSIASVSTSQIQVQTATTAPSGGGFEVRRSDGKFGAGTGADLVLRSTAPNFTILREAPVERYYVRMYDGAQPPNYSRFSSALFINAATQ